MQLTKRRQLVRIMMLLVMVIGIILPSSGCSLFKEYMFVQKRLPVIPKPDRPTMTVIDPSELISLTTETKEKLVQRDVALKKYARKLEAGVDIYNDYARKTNDQSGLFDSLKGIE